MEVFRISKEKYIRDLSGLGSYIAGGRWNSPGVFVLYTSASRALASMESLVHITSGDLPVDFKIATLYIPEDSMTFVDEINLFPAWDALVPNHELRKFGEHWISNCQTLSLRVPSVVAVPLRKWRRLIRMKCPPPIRFVCLPPGRSTAVNSRLSLLLKGCVVGRKCCHLVVGEPRAYGLHNGVGPVFQLIGVEHRNELIFRPSNDRRDAFVLAVVAMTGDAFTGKILAECNIGRRSSLCSSGERRPSGKK